MWAPIHSPEKKASFWGTATGHYETTYECTHGNQSKGKEHRTSSCFGQSFKLLPDLARIDDSELLSACMSWLVRTDITDYYILHMYVESDKGVVKHQPAT